jgi:hypothetical protein
MFGLVVGVNDSMITSEDISATIIDATISGEVAGVSVGGDGTATIYGGTISGTTGVEVDSTNKAALTIATTDATGNEYGATKITGTTAGVSVQAGTATIRGANINATGEGATGVSVSDAANVSISDTSISVAGEGSTAISPNAAENQNVTIDSSTATYTVSQKEITGDAKATALELTDDEKEAILSSALFASSEDEQESITLSATAIEAQIKVAAANKLDLTDAADSDGGIVSSGIYEVTCTDKGGDPVKTDFAGGSLTFTLDFPQSSTNNEDGHYVVAQLVMYQDAENESTTAKVEYIKPTVTESGLTVTLTSLSYLVVLETKDEVSEETIKKANALLGNVSDDDTEDDTTATQSGKDSISTLIVAAGLVTVAVELALVFFWDRLPTNNAESTAATAADATNSLDGAYLAAEVSAPPAA